MNIIVCGDSHAGIFHFCNFVQNTYNFIGLGCPGASARGVLNPHSISNSLNVFNELLENNKAERVLVMLGEVDCSYLAWVSSYRYNTSVEEQLEKSVGNLFEFIETFIMQKNGYESTQIIVAGSVLAAIGDHADKRRLHSLRPNVKATQKEVTDKILAYNGELKRRCLENGYSYVDITDRIMGDDGVVDSYYVRENIYDHHLDSYKTRPLWIEELTKALQG